MSKTFYVNLFHNGFFRFTGFKKKLENGEDGGKRPVMLPMSTKILSSFKRTAKRFPYELDPKKNIKKFSVGDYEIAFLIPTSDVKGLSPSDYESSIWFELSGSEEERVQDLEQQVQNLEDELGKKKKTIRNLRSEEEEQNKGSSSSSSSKLVCPQCRTASSETAWSNNGEVCPNCQQVHKDDPNVMRQ